MNVLINNQKISYQNDIQHSYMVLELRAEEEIIDYQLRMIQENPTKQLLMLHKRQLDDKLLIFYDITSKITLGQLLKKKRLNRYEFLKVLRGLISCLKLGKKYLLQGGTFLLDCNYIYIDAATLELSLAYLPIASEVEMNSELKVLLMDLVVYKITFQSPEDSEGVFKLLELIKEEGFNLFQLDKLINEMALQKGEVSISKSHQLQEASHKENSSSKTQSNTASGNALKTAPVLLQIFLAALAALLLRYLHIQKGSFDIAAIIGVFTITVSLDVLLLKKLKMIKKPEDGVLLKPMKKVKKRHKNSKVIAMEQATAEKLIPDIMPSYLETRLLSADIVHTPCLVSCDESKRERIFVDKQSFIIGRLKSQSDYVSENNAVGKLHAEIINREGKYYLKDLNSRNGSFINGERIVSNVEYCLQNNDKIAFANSEYKFIKHP